MIAVRPCAPLSGTVKVDGSKNAALALIAAAAALHQTVQLSNVPASTDVQTMLGLLHGAGWHVGGPVGVPDVVTVAPSRRGTATPLLPNTGDGHASGHLVPALLTSYGRARLHWPLGSPIAGQGLASHLRVYEAFGDQVTADEDAYLIKAGKPRLGRVSHVLPFRSRGATLAAVLRAVATRRPLALGQPNLSPEVVSVLEALQAAGWGIHSGGTTLSLTPPPTGGNEPVRWTVPGDKSEAGVLACALAATGGSGRIDGVRASDVRSLTDALEEVGVPVAAEAESLVVRADNTRLSGRPLRAIVSLSPGGLDADFEPPLMALALGLPGTHLFADSVNPDRHGSLLPHLARLGADIHAISPTQCRLTGPQRLHGAGIEAVSIRTGSALLVAGLVARGVTTLGGVNQLQRGHADLPGKLRALGADICEVRP
ncbi:UDP-N-acetylglucosamine 1-carboxyvinyltransferase [Streptomyces sp. NPDC020731]|uniref:UDP-N-acetylglucosamine 1-carboxyvinyltransferase n=1 Tax=Streptomyces sp. NPDC020731 TaxID=3365085 RepID=UPI0037A35046